MFKDSENYNESINIMCLATNIRAKLRHFAVYNPDIVKTFEQRLLESHVLGTLSNNITEHYSIINDSDVSINYTIENVSMQYFSSCVTSFTYNPTIQSFYFHYLHHNGYLFGVLSSEDIRFIFNNESRCKYIADIFNIDLHDGRFILKISF